MKILFVISQNASADKIKGISPFVMPQINSIIPHLEDHKLCYVASGFSAKTISNNRALLQEMHHSLKGENWVVFAMYGSLMGYLATKYFKGKRPVLLAFGGSDLMGSRNAGVIWKLRDALTKKLSQYAAKSAQQIIVKSDELFQKLNTSEQKKATIIPNGIDLKLFTILDNPESLRRKLGWSGDEFVILFNMRRNNAKSETVKNYALAEDVIQILTSKFGNRIRLELISGKTHSEINEMLNTANCLLLTSLHEGSPNIVKESMACNLPVVTVNCGDVAIRLKDVSPSYVSKAYNASELAEYIEKLVIDSKRSNGRDQLIKSGLDNENIALQIVELATKAAHTFH